MIGLMRALERAGDTAAAIEAYDHWLALHVAPEESRRDEVERVRALVDRLEGGGR